MQLPLPSLSILLAADWRPQQSEVEQSPWTIPPLLPPSTRLTKISSCTTCPTRHWKLPRARTAGGRQLPSPQRPAFASLSATDEAVEAAAGTARGATPPQRSPTGRRPVGPRPDVNLPGRRATQRKVC